MNIYGITVDSPAQNYKEYCTQMSQYENLFVRQLINVTTPKEWEVCLKELIASRIEDGESLIDVDRNRAVTLLNSAIALANLIDDIIVDFDEVEKYVRKFMHNSKVLL